MAYAPDPSPVEGALAELPLGAPRLARQCAELCLDLLLAEAVRVYAAGPGGGSGENGDSDAAAAATTMTSATTTTSKPPPRIVTPAPVALEAAGVRVGRAFAERLCCRGAGGGAGGGSAGTIAGLGGGGGGASARPRPPGDALDAVKFVCKEFWAAAFRKQVDALRTNHRGTFVLQDNAFRPLLFLAPPLPGATLGAHGAGAAASAAAAAAAATAAGGDADADAAEQRRRVRAEAAARAALPHLWFPCGVVRGALAQLGVECTVEADARALPACTFTVKILG